MVRVWPAGSGAGGGGLNLGSGRLARVYYEGADGAVGDSWIRFDQDVALKAEGEPDDGGGASLRGRWLGM